MFGRSALRIADLVRNDVDVEQVTHHSSTGSGAESRIGGNSSSRDARVPSSASSDCGGAGSRISLHQAARTHGECAPLDFGHS
jgi:hypothetical protein